MLIDSNIQYYVNVNYPKVCLQMQYNSSKNEIDNPILIFKWKCQKPKIAETPRKKRTQSNILYSRYKDWQWSMKQNWVQKYAYRWFQFIFDKGYSNLVQRGQSCQQIVLQKLDMHI